MDLETFIRISNGWIKEENEIDGRIQKARDNIEGFFSNISNEEDKLIVDKLIENFEYYSAYKINKSLKELYEKFIKENVWEKGTKDTVFSFIKPKPPKETNSSKDLCYEFRKLNEVDENNFVEDISKTEKNWNEIKNIVFIDDFSGTGKSFIDEIKENKNIFRNKKVYFLTIVIMNKAEKKIKNKAKEYDFKFYSISIKNKDKILEEKVFENNEEVKKRIEKLSEELGIYGRHIMGFNNTQALIAFSENTPNNTFGIFWKDTPKNKPLFPREKRHSPNPKTMNTDKKEKKGANYNSRVEENKNG